MSSDQPDWLPDWYPRETSSNRQDTRATPALPAASVQHVNEPLLSKPIPAVDDESSTAPSDAPSAGKEPPEKDNIVVLPPKTIVVEPNLDRTVRRRLRGIHLFMITINGTLGTGLYWRGGQILELGGPLAVLLSFLLVGLLAWAVMQCITEMLCIWPIPGALAVYVSEFVDAELGIAVGIAYWYTYSVSFAALIATTAAEVEFWGYSKGIEGGIIFLLIPSILVLINAFGIEIYGFIEVVGGTLKISFFFVILLALIAINVGAGPNPAIGTQYWNSPAPFDKDAAQNWGVAFFMSLSTAAFAYVGVEIVAASALEARWPKTRAQTDDSNFSRSSAASTMIGKTVKFSAIFISVFATILYVIGGLLASFDIRWDHPDLPRLSWVHYTATDPSLMKTSGTTSSAFVAIASESGIQGLAHIFNAFLVFTALTCANTNLYVASRSLFGLTSRLDGGSGQPLYLRVLAWLGKTNHRKVPTRSMIVSAIAFWWVPFLQLSDDGGISDSNPIGKFIEVLAEMGSVGVVIVWACECWAFIRYYHCIDKHQHILKQRNISQVRRWDLGTDDDYPYRSHGQPVTAYLAFGACLFLLLVSNGAALWKGFHIEPFLSSYLTIIVFLALWVLLKVMRGAKWELVDLSNPDRVVKKLRDLHDIRFRGVDEKEIDPPTIWNFWGVI